ncbi:calcium-binding protein [Falsiroseomonas sp. HC035]|uniref:calcium-binding protein n=1 Tax=Falsiroseomonas sp. HC035 TaxID=3390999 RepID=UPI003D313296
MATISGGDGVEVGISPPQPVAPGEEADPSFGQALSGVQAAIEAGAVVRTFNPNSPPVVPTDGTPYVLLIDRETLAAAGGTDRIVVPAGVDYLVIEDGVSVPIEILANPNGEQVTVVGGSSANIYTSSGSINVNDSGGDNLVVIRDEEPDGEAFGTAVTGSEIRLGGGADTVVAGSGNDTVVAGAGDDIVFLGAGNDVTYVQGNDTVVTGSGNDTVGVDFGNVLVGGSSGAITFINGSGTSTVVGGSGTTTIFGGTGGGLYFGGSAGNNVMVAGDGATTLVGGGSGDVLFAAGPIGDLLVAGPGNTTLSGGSSTGNNTFIAGTGNDLVGGGIGNDTIIAGTGDDTYRGGGGEDMFAFFKELSAGGNVLIGDFAPGADKITLQGYADNIDALVAGQVKSAAGVTINLSDGTQITFAGIDELKRDNFV